jgi:4-amino-4-deoxy-L-arabinose transferase-like glycosyltransferase
MVVGALMLIGLALRLYRLGQQSLWFDEAEIWYFALQPLHQIIPLQQAIGDRQLPLYYALMHLMLHFGQQEWLLRFPSVVFSTLTMPALYVFARRWGQPTALLATALLSLSAFDVWLTQEAKHYALWVLLLLWATHCFMAVLEGGGNWYVAGFALSAALAMLCHYFSFLMGMGFAAWLAAVRPPQQRRGWLCLLAAVALWSPYLPLLWHQLHIHLPYTETSPGLLHPFYLLATGGALPLGANGIVLCGAAVLALTAWGAWLLGRRASLLMWLSAVIIFGSYAISTLTAQHIFRSKYSCAVLPFLLLMWAAAFYRLPVVPRLVALSLWLLLNGCSLFNFFTDPYYQNVNYRAMAAILREDAGPGDAVVAFPDEWQIGLRYYGWGQAKLIATHTLSYGDLENLSHQYQHVWLFFPPPLDDLDAGRVTPHFDPYFISRTAGLQHEDVLFLGRFIPGSLHAQPGSTRYNPTPAARPAAAASPPSP